MADSTVTGDKAATGEKSQTDLISSAHAYLADGTVRGSGCDDESNGGGSPVKWDILGGQSYPITQGWGYTPYSAGNPSGIYTYSLGYGGVHYWHPAVDIGCPDNTPVYAANDGTVEYAGPDQYYNPNHVNIRATNGALEIYGHLLQVSVEVGQQVKRGDPLGLSGHQMTPYVSGAHLHYEVRVPDSTTPNGELCVNPCEYLSGVSFTANSGTTSGSSSGGIWGGVTSAITDIMLRGFILLVAIVIIGVGLRSLTK